MASVRCDFILTGHGYDPNVITQALGIQPTRTWREGEPIPHSSVLYKHEGWCLTNGPVESLDLQEVASPLLATLGPLLNTLTDLIVQLGVEAELAYTVRKMEAVPTIHFDRAMLMLLDGLQAEVDIDIYV